MSTYPQDWCVSAQTQGGNGGSSFSSYKNAEKETLPDGSKQEVYYTVSKIGCYIAAHRMTKISVWFSNDDSGYSNYDAHVTWGENSGGYKEFVFVVGERLKTLTIYKAEYSGNDYCGGLEFTTTMGRSFSAKSGNAESGEAMDVGYGAVVGIFGNSGEAVDKLGFWLIQTPIEVALSNVAYSQVPQAPGSVAVANQVYTNTGTEPLNMTYSYTQTVESTETWTLTTTSTESYSFTVGISAPVYGVTVSAEGTASWSTTQEESNQLTYAESTTEAFNYSFTVPPNSQTTLNVSHFTGAYSMTYTGFAVATLNNLNTFNYYLTGEVKGACNTELTATTNTVALAS